MTTNKLLHVCCASCALVALERWESISLFFYNPSIPTDEYERRYSDVRKIASIYEVPIIDASHDHDAWLKRVKGMEAEPENGKRCMVCYQDRLEQAYKAAVDNGFDGFATTLTLSPHKNAQIINRIGKEIGGEFYISSDFKKQDGFNLSVRLSRKYGLYRQTFCGCEMSMQSPRL
ncbi:MAG: epoxyqueuosine reductase QueH [Candidatus Woesearchaeota archaeon]